jgi:hypothetical protein
MFASIERDYTKHRVNRSGRVGLNGNSTVNILATDKIIQKRKSVYLKSKLSIEL